MAAKRSDAHPERGEASLSAQLAEAQAELAELRALRDRLEWCEMQSAEGVRIVWGEYRLTGKRFCSVMSGRYVQFESESFSESLDLVRERTERLRDPRGTYLS